MSASLGEKLRQAREERGISIGEVAEQTRISSLYLKSIEDDNYKPLPGGIFNKGFVKAYAKYVGIDEQEALQDYARLVAQTEEQQSESQPPRYRPEVLTDDRSASSLVPTIVFAGIILALMTGGILFVVNYIQNQSDAPAVATNSVNSNADVGSNVEPQGAVNPEPLPVPNEIRLEFRALSEKVSVTSTVDGNLAYDEVSPGAPKTYTAQQGVKLRYYRGFADKVQILLNGKQVAAPAPPPRGNIEFEVNKENVAQIMESGQLIAVGTPVPPSTSPSPQATSTATQTTSSPAPVPRTSTPRPVETTPRPAFTPQPTPRRSPTPIIVGRPPAARPSPN
ncbi:MAG TPA: helix-turn-helix domain-containing protein [Pyrinomonadaceae bacterium]